MNLGGQANDDEEEVMGEGLDVNQEQETLADASTVESKHCL